MGFQLPELGVLTLAMMVTIITGGIDLSVNAISNLAAVLAGFFLVALVLTVTLFEFWRAARARQRAQEENFFTALSRLTGRNRRRYGGYIIHISMMLMAIGILGIEIFQMETQGTAAVDGKLAVGGYTVEYNDIATFQGPDQRR